MPDFDMGLSKGFPTQFLLFRSREYYINTFGEGQLEPRGDLGRLRSIRQLELDAGSLY